MTKKQRDRQRQCEICSASVKNATNLAKHCLETGHQADQCCRQCIKWFGSKEALEQHRVAKHMQPPTLHSVPHTGDSILPSPALGSYAFTDRQYKPLAPLDMNVVYHQLLVACHPQDRLRSEGYILPDDLNDESCVEMNEAGTLERCLLPSPSCDIFFPKRKAVAFDCEMAGVEGGRSEVVSICAVDFFTGQVLLRSLVKPREPIIEWRSNINGIIPATMAIAAARRQTLDGWESARKELWKHINEDTVLVGQSLHFDLKALRVVHTKIFDTAIVSRDAAFGRGNNTGRRWGLETLCKELLHLRIRQGSGVHDDLEDTMAAREVALWCLSHPVELLQWGDKARKSFYLERERNRRSSQRQVMKAPRAASNDDGEEVYYAWQYDSSDGDSLDWQEGDTWKYDSRDDEILRWEDVVDWETWPKSPPDSD